MFPYTHATFPELAFIINKGYLHSICLILILSLALH